MLPDAGFTGLIPLHEIDDAFRPWLLQFFSGRPSLDVFLKTGAQDLHDDHLSTTSLIFHENFDGVVAYITLANDAVQLTAFEEGELGLRDHYALRTFPAVKICRLAVHAELQRQGIGELVMELAMGQVIDTQRFCAARLLITDAVNEEAVLRFYKRLGFFDSGWAANEAGKKGGQQHHALPLKRETIKMLRDIYAE